MGQSTIERQTRHLTATFAVSSTLSPAIDVRAFAGGAMVVPSPWGGGTCSFKVAPTAGGTYRPLRDKDGTLVQINPTAGAIHELHAALMAAHYAKVVKAIAVTGTRQLDFLLKG